MALSPYEIATLRASIRKTYKPDWISRAVPEAEIPPSVFHAGPDWAIVHHGSIVALTPSLLIALSALHGEFNEKGYLDRILNPAIDPETVCDPALTAERRRKRFENDQAMKAYNETRQKAEARRAQLFDLDNMSLDSLDRLSDLD
jgi:hypothetical protein